MRVQSSLMVAMHAQQYMSSGPASSITLTSGLLASRPLGDGSGWVSTFAAAMDGMTKGLALDLAPIRVNLVLPGPVDTPIW